MAVDFRPDVCLGKMHVLLDGLQFQTFDNALIFGVILTQISYRQDCPLTNI